MQLHNIVIRIIAKYLTGSNRTLVHLRSLNTRFYGIHEIFVKRIKLNKNQSITAYQKKPNYWNKVFYMTFSERMTWLLSPTPYPILDPKRIGDLSALGGLRHLELHDCHYVTDVSPLARLHTIRMTNCPYVSDVSPLRNLHTLGILYCRIIDVSALGQIRKLTIKGCLGITDISALKTVKKLKISDCPNIIKK